MRGQPGGHATTIDRKKAEGLGAAVVDLWQGAWRWGLKKKWEAEGVWSGRGSGEHVDRRRMDVGRTLERGVPSRDTMQQAAAVECCERIARGVHQQQDAGLLQYGAVGLCSKLLSRGLGRLQMGQEGATRCSCPGYAPGWMRDAC